MVNPKHLKLSFEHGGKTLRVTINRPEVRNSFNAQLIEDYHDLFAAITAGDKQFESVRAVLLHGAGAAFCGGGDLNWMGASLKLSHEDNLADTLRLARMFNTMDRCPVPVVGMVHGFAIGGGVGLVSICDHVIAAEDTVFSLSEVKLGLIPACIGPFVIGKIGASQARSLFVSGERFKGDKAARIGLVHDICPAAELEARAQKILTQMHEGGPVAIRAAKFLVHTITRELAREDFNKAIEFGASELAQLRVQPEAQEGVKAFLEKRTPSWRS